MDERQVERVNEAAQKFAEAVRESYQTVADRAVSAQQLNAELTQNFFNSVINNLRSQAESNRQMTEELQGQQERQREATQALTQESVGAYMDFVNSMFSYYQGTVESVEPRETRGAATEAVEPAGERTEVQMGEGDLPLADYDSLNVREVSERLEEFSVEEVEQLRRYEAVNKNRSTLLRRFDDRIEAGT
jgi:hypothetical protein